MKDMTLNKGLNVESSSLAQRAWRTRWALATIVLISVVASLLLTLLQTPIYQAESAAVVAVDKSRSVTDLSLAANFAQSNANTYAQVATSSAVLDGVREQLRLSYDVEKLRSYITVSSSPTSAVISVTVASPNVREVAPIANAVITQLGSVVKSLTSTASGGPDVSVALINAATPPVRATSPSLLTNLGVGVVVGVLLAFAYVSLLRRRQLAQTDVRDRRSGADREQV